MINKKSSIKKQSLYIVILAGGKGERLWPLSREKMPKQLLPFGDNCSLLTNSINRVKSLVPKENLWIITTAQQKPLIEKMVAHKVGTIIAEPVSRNTAPAILLACLKIKEQDQNATIAFLPADHVIMQEETFRKDLEKAMHFSVNHEVITLLGLKPDWPATGYGYIEFKCSNTIEKNLPQKVIRFHEKPLLETAKLYIQLNNMLWNIGIFCAKVTTFIHEYNIIASELFNIVNEFVKTGAEDIYEKCENISIDCAVLERSTISHVLPVDFTWSDVGNLDIFLTITKKYKNSPSKTIEINSQQNIVEVANKLVALIDVENLCIVETDDVLLISKRDQTDKVKNILSVLRNQKNNEHYL